MKKYWEKVREFLKRPKVIKWSIIILTILIIVGTVIALVWTIYTDDKPAFVPEEIRKDIQGAIKESGEAIKAVSNPIGTAIVDAGYIKELPCACFGSDETENWPTYVDEDLGISIKYPANFRPEFFSELFGDYIGTLEFKDVSSDEVIFDIDIFESMGLTATDWLNKLSRESNTITGIVSKDIGGRIFVKATEAGDPDHYIYVIKNGEQILKYKTLFVSAELLENVLSKNN